MKETIVQWLFTLGYWGVVLFFVYGTKLFNRGGDAKDWRLTAFWIAAGVFAFLIFVVGIFSYGATTNLWDAYDI